MSAVTREEIVAVLGSVDDQLITEILAVGASPEELTTAKAWLTNNEAPMNAGAPLATGRVAKLIELIEADDAQTLDEPPPAVDEL